MSDLVDSVNFYHVIRCSCTDGICHQLSNAFIEKIQDVHEFVVYINFKYGAHLVAISSKCDEVHGISGKT